MRFFESSVEGGVHREDVLTVLDGLDEVIGPLQTLCDSPRESERNDAALKGVLDTRSFIYKTLSSPQLTDDEAEHEPSSPTANVS